MFIQNGLASRLPVSVAQTLPPRSPAVPDIARMLASAACRSASRGSCVAGCVPNAFTVFHQAAVFGSVQIGPNSFEGHAKHVQTHETPDFLLTHFLICNSYQFLIDSKKYSGMICTHTQAKIWTRLQVCAHMHFDAHALVGCCTRVDRYTACMNVLVVEMLIHFHKMCEQAEP